MTLYYQVNYTLTEVPADAAYFHAQFRRVNKLPPKTMYTILDGVQGQGPVRRHLSGLGSPQSGLVGRGGDQVLHGRRPGVPHHLRHRHRGLLLRLLQFREPARPIATRRSARPTPGWPRCCRRTSSYRPGQRFGLYRWHIADPVRFQKELKVTIQALGWQSGGRYLPLEDDIASVAYWYQTRAACQVPPAAG